MSSELSEQLDKIVNLFDRMESRFDRLDQLNKIVKLLDRMEHNFDRLERQVNRLDHSVKNLQRVPVAYGRPKVFQSVSEFQSVSGGRTKGLGHMS